MYLYPLFLNLRCLPVPAQILGGAVVAQGELDATVTAVGGNTFFGKTISLLGATQEQGHLLKVHTFNDDSGDGDGGIENENENGSSVHIELIPYC